jgi:hypothetical protein
MVSNISNQAKQFGLAILAILLLVFALAACGENPTPSPTAETKKPVTSLSNVNGVKELAVDQEIQTVLAKDFGPDVQDFKLQIFVSDDTPANFIAALDSYATGQGYTFNVPGETKPSVTGGGSAVGFYSKTGSADIMGTASLIGEKPADSLKALGVSEPTAQKFAEQYKGKKSSMVVISAVNLSKGVEYFAPTVGPVFTPVQRGLGNPIGVTPTPHK